MIKSLIGPFPDKIPEDVVFDIKSIAEEKANWLSHGIGLLLFIVVSPVLIFISYNSGNLYHFVGTLVYSLTLIMLYSSSTAYHGTYHLDLRRRLRIFDHVFIYFLIAGSYTPFILTHVRTQAGWIVLGVLWLMVLLGSIFKIFYTHRFRVLSTLAYLIMGWMAVFIAEPLWQNVPRLSLYWIAAGGFFYTTGCIFYLWEKLYHSHLIWHLFVLAGSVSHFVAVYYCV